MWIKKFSVFIFIYYLASNILNGQCDINRLVPILDQDTTRFSIVVDGLTTDSLQHPGQGLCGVRIDFRHEFVGDISIQLISPSGQSVFLVGPAVPVSGNTSFTRWNVFFIPCGSEPLPDPGFSPVWDNLQPWGIFGNYSGQYHPFAGCLEDFSFGPVNGTWTLLIEDVSQFGSGRIQGVQLIFCDEEGVNCSPCQLDPGDLTSAIIEKCESSSLFTLENVQESFSTFPKDTARYFYEWALFRDSTWVDVFPQGQSFFLEVGSHKLCNLQYAKSMPDLLPILPMDLDVREANEWFQMNNRCAAISDSCVQIIVYPSTDTVFVDTTICKDEIIFIQGTEIDAPGLYTIQIPGTICDTIMVLNVSETDFNVLIQTDSDSISCGFPIITITASVQTSSNDSLLYSWSTDGGHIIETGLDSIIQVNIPGIYFLEVSDGYCTTVVQKEIFTSVLYPEVSISGFDTLTCLRDTITLKFESNVSVSTFSWNSAQSIINLGDSIKVFLPGEYQISLFTDQNCEINDNIEIFADQVVQPVLLESDTITCTLDTVRITLNHEESGLFEYSWSGVLAGEESLQRPHVIEGGMKYVQVLNTLTGCTRLDSLYIEDQRVYPVIQIEVLPITCVRDSVMSQLISDIAIADYNWEGPGLMSTDSVVIINQAGFFTVTVTSTEGCITIEDFNVFVDTITANILLQTDSLSCLRDSVMIQVNSDKLLETTLWFDENGMVISEILQPYIFIPGNYTLTATDTSGCISVQEIEVYGATELPNVSFDFPVIDCTNDTFYIIPDKQNGYMFTWTFPDSSVSGEKVLSITEPGEYFVTVTNEIQPECQEIHRIQLEDFRIFPEFSIVKESFTCLKDSARISVTFGPGNYTWEISGPAGTVFNESEWVVHDLGWYYITASNEFNCITRDSFEIFLDDVRPVLSITSMDTITCKNALAHVDFASSLPSTTFNVFRDNILIANGPSVNLTDDGEFVVVGTAGNACTDTLQFSIIRDTLAPDVNIFPFDTITCLSPETDLFAFSNTPFTEISWNNVAVNPITVSEGGSYLLTVLQTKNGCKTERLVLVPERKIYASFTKITDTITCRNETAEAGIQPLMDFKTIFWNPNNPDVVIDGEVVFLTMNPGTYYFSIESSASCIQEDSIIILVDNKSPIPDVITAPEINCFNPEVTLSVSISQALDSILWTKPGGQKLEGLNIQTGQEGIHNLRLIGTNGCVTDTTVVVEKHVELPQFTTFTDSLSCKKGKGVIGVESNDSFYEVTWSGPGNYTSMSPTALVTVAGTYQVIVTSANGCKDSAEVIVPGNYLTPVLLVKDTFFIPCDSSMIELNVQSSDSLIQYYWEREGMPFSEEASPLTNTAGLYTVWVTGLNGCRSIQEFEVIQVRLPAGFKVTSDSINCLKKTAILSAESPHSLATFTWITPNGQMNHDAVFETTEGGTFKLVVQDENKCLDTVLVHVAIDTAGPDITIVQEGIIACEQRTALLMIPDSLRKPYFEYNWFGNPNQMLSSPDQGELSIVDPGIFSVSVTNELNGCSTFLPFEAVEVPSPFNHFNLDISHPPCPDFNFGSFVLDSLNGYPPFKVIINNILYGDQKEFTLLSPGIYAVQVSDGIGCLLDTIITIQKARDLTLPIPSDTLLNLGDSIILFNNLPDSIWSDFSFYILERGDTLCSSCPRPFILFPGQTTSFFIGATSPFSPCRLEQVLIVELQEGILSGIPNVISHTALEEKNRWFFIPKSRGIENIIAVEIYDKWGNPLFGRYNFPPGDISLGWDGTYNGQWAETGVYVVVCKILLSNGNIITYHGDLTILD